MEELIRKFINFFESDRISVKTAFIIHFKINDYEKEFNWSEIWTVNCDFRIR